MTTRWTTIRGCGKEGCGREVDGAVHVIQELKVEGVRGL